MSSLITIKNDGQEIVETNYWASDYFMRGAVYLSINAGAFRLLVPSQIPIDDMVAADEVIVTRGAWPEAGKHEALELMFEDYSDNPYCIHIGSEQIDRPPADSDRHKSFVFAIWTQDGKVKELPARYRKANRIPFMKPWKKVH
jgi:hypothetical protein